MERRKLAAAAGALSVTAFATTVCLGANLGLFGLTQPESPVGRFDSAHVLTASAQVDVAPPPSIVTIPPVPRDADD